MSDDETKKKGAEIKDEPVSDDTESDDDIVEFVSEEGEDLKHLDPIQKIKELKEKLKVCQKERQEYLSSWQRERADFQNFKKDETERMIRSIGHAREQVVFNLLPALDSYDMAFSNKEVWEKVDKNWRVGVEYIHQQILKALEEYGVTSIKTKVGDIIDLTLHQPIETIETDDKEKNHTIVSIAQTGYKIGDKVLRPVRVNVFEYKKQN